MVSVTKKSASTRLTLSRKIVNCFTLWLNKLFWKAGSLKSFSICPYSLLKTGMLPSERFFSALKSRSNPWARLWDWVGSTMALSV